MSSVATSELRRQLVIEIVTRAKTPLVASVVLEAAFLVRRDDFTWAVNEASKRPDSLAKSIMSTLAVEIARDGKQKSKTSALRSAGVDAVTAEAIASGTIQMPRMFDRWKPPKWFTNQQAEEAGSDAGEQDPDEESLLEAWSDIHLQHLREAAPGRTPATPVEASTMLALADHADARLIRSDRDLADAVLESLTRAQRRLKGRTPMNRSLWNEATGRATPKEENFLSDFLADHLRTDLVGRAIAADREVEVRPKIADTQGQRTDIQIQAFSTSSIGTRRSKIASITVEVKGCWNPDLFTAMKEQLYDRYMITTSEAVGVFLVGCYFCDSWKTPKVAGLVDRNPQALTSLTKKLEDQARQLSVPGKEVEVFILDASLT